MNQPDELTQVARQRADERLDKAIGELRKAAAAIGQRYAIPENIAGHAVAELLGRMAWVPSMARDLRRAAGQEIAKLELAELMAGRPPIAMPDPVASPGRPPSAPPGPAADPPPAAPRRPVDIAKLPATTPTGMDLADLSGVSVQTVRACKEGGLKTVADVIAVPDEHLCKLRGLAEKSVQQLRHAIALASQPKPGPQ